MSMTKRDYIGQILARKSRLPHSVRWQQVSTRLRRLDIMLEVLDAFSPLGPFADRRDAETQRPQIDLPYIFESRQAILEFEREALRYIPVGLVACIEGYFRVAYADLINSGSPFIENVVKLDQLNIKLDLQLAIDMRQKSVTLGDFVAHALPTSSLFDINKHMTILIGPDFLGEMKAALPRTEDMRPLFPEEPRAKEARVISGVTRAFELRHIFCHEADPTGADARTADFWTIAAAVVEFLNASEVVLNDKLPTGAAGA